MKGLHSLDRRAFGDRSALSDRISVDRRRERIDLEFSDYRMFNVRGAMTHLNPLEIAAVSFSSSGHDIKEFARRQGLPVGDCIAAHVQGVTKISKYLSRKGTP